MNHRGTTKKNRCMHATSERVTDQKIEKMGTKKEARVNNKNKRRGTKNHEKRRNIVIISNKNVFQERIVGIHQSSAPTQFGEDKKNNQRKSK